MEGEHPCWWPGHSFTASRMVLDTLWYHSPESQFKGSLRSTKSQETRGAGAKITRTWQDLMRPPPSWPHNWPEPSCGLLSCTCCRTPVPLVFWVSRAVCPLLKWGLSSLRILGKPQVAASRQQLPTRTTAHQRRSQLSSRARQRSVPKDASASRLNSPGLELPPAAFN